MAIGITTIQDIVIEKSTPKLTATIKDEIGNPLANALLQSLELLLIETNNNEIKPINDRNSSVLQLGNDTDDDLVRMSPKILIPFDSTKLYKISCKIRQTSGIGTAFIGVAGKGSNGVNWVNSYGLNDYMNDQYNISAVNASPSAWTVYTGYIKGTSDTASAGPFPNGDVNNPSSVHTNVKFITPYITVNHPDTSNTPPNNWPDRTGAYQVDYFRVSELAGGVPGGTESIIYEEFFRNSIIDIQSEWINYQGLGEFSKVIVPQDVLNKNNVTVDSNGIMVWLMQPKDTKIVDPSLNSEIHRAIFTWTYSGGTKTGRYIIDFTIQNIEGIV